MSDTPRVDSYVYKFPGCQREPRLIDFARKLERELAEARAEINIIEHDANVLIGDIKAELERKDKLIEQMKSEIERLKRCCNCEYANHKLEICEHPDNEPETFMDGVCDFWSHNI